MIFAEADAGGLSSGAWLGIGGLGLAALGAVFGVVASMWGKFKSILWRVVSLVIRRVGAPLMCRRGFRLRAHHGGTGGEDGHESRQMEQRGGDHPSASWPAAPAQEQRREPENRCWDGRSDGPPASSSSSGSLRLASMR